MHWNLIEVGQKLHLNEPKFEHVPLDRQIPGGCAIHSGVGVERFVPNTHHATFMQGSDRIGRAARGMQRPILVRVSERATVWPPLVLVASKSHEGARRDCAILLLVGIDVRNAHRVVSVLGYVGVFVDDH